MGLDPKDLFDPIDGEPLRDALGYLQNSKIKEEQRSIRKGQQETNQKLGQIAELLKKQEQEQKRISNLPKCPYCGGVIEGKFEICKHCGSRLGYVNGKVCKIEDLEYLQKKHNDVEEMKSEQKRQKDAERAELQRKLKYKENAEKEYISQKRECFIDNHGNHCIRFTCYCGTRRRTQCYNIGSEIEGCSICGKVKIYGQEEYDRFLLELRKEKTTIDLKWFFIILCICGLVFFMIR